MAASLAERLAEDASARDASTISVSMLLRVLQCANAGCAEAVALIASTPPKRNRYAKSRAGSARRGRKRCLFKSFGLRPVHTLGQRAIAPRDFCLTAVHDGVGKPQAGGYGRRRAGPVVATAASRPAQRCAARSAAAAQPDCWVGELRPVGREQGGLPAANEREVSGDARTCIFAPSGTIALPLQTRKALAFSQAVDI